MSRELVVHDDLWLSIRNGLEIQLMNAEDAPGSLLDGERLDRMAEGIRAKILEAHRVEHR